MSPELQTTLTWMFWIYLILIAGCVFSMMVMLVIPVFFAAFGSLVGAYIGSLFGSSVAGAIIGGVIGASSFVTWWFVRMVRREREEDKLQQHGSYY